MKKLFNSPLFQVYAFFISFAIINVYVIFKVDIDKLFNSYIMIYTTWFLVILLLKVISDFLIIEEEKDV